MKDTWPAAVEVLARGGSQSEAAQAAKVTTRTVRTWKADQPRFQDAVEDARSLLLNETAGLLAAATTTAARRLAQIAEDPEPRYALPAARIILDQAARYQSDRAIEDRIEALEAAVNLRSGWQ